MEEQDKKVIEALPHIILKLDKPRRFRFDFMAMADFQGMTGIRMSEFPELEDRIDKDVSVMVALLWAGMKGDDENLDYVFVGRHLTPEIAGKMIDPLFEYLDKVALEQEEPGKNVKRVTPKKTVPRNRGRGKAPSKQPVESG